MTRSPSMVSQQFWSIGYFSKPHHAYMQGKVLHPKYYKKHGYALAQKTHFDPKKYTLKPNLQFSDFYVSQVFSAEAAMYRNSNFVLILDMKV